MVNAQTENRGCRICGAYGAKPTTLSSGHRAQECIQCGGICAETNEIPENIYETVYDRQEAGTIYNSYLATYERITAGHRPSPYWFQKAFLAQYHPQKGDRLLDVGCGVGGFLTICREAGWDVCGLDVSQQAVDLARDILPDVPIHRGTLAEAPWPALTFTAITIWEVIEHVEDPLATICAAEKLLKTGGVLAISTPDWGSRYVRCHPSPTWWPPFHIWFFREKSLRALLTMSEMQVTSVRRMPVPWGVTKWPRRKRILALPWLAWCGIVRREGGGRLWATAKKI